MTSERSKRICNWILSLAKQKMNNEERNEQLKKFLLLIVPKEICDKAQNILNQANLNIILDNRIQKFYSRSFHSEIYRNSFKLFQRRELFPHSIGSCKSYENLVKERSKSKKIDRI